jgi:predicted small secreted protein
MKFFFIFIFVSLVMALAFSGCQTADGIGKDIENLGESIQD